MTRRCARTPESCYRFLMCVALRCKDSELDVAARKPNRDANMHEFDKW
jgi:hypothetical protein